MSEAAPAAGQEGWRVGRRATDALPAAWEALRRVYDPELYLDVVSLGLVYDVREETGSLVVEMTLTTPGCPASESLPEMARDAIEAAVGSAVPVEVRVVWDPPWSPAMMDREAARALGFRSA
ncbi:MAG TPA: metal-sulfur cluster assembly factor [Acidimicrobiales bacterium]|nr:metal-sulfur cluster assembly factor [Acidimicrobiales bacterium]